MSKRLPKASDCTFTAPLETGAAAEDGRIPIKMLARSNQPIQHYWWGRVLHDFGTMTHEPKIVMDYEHGDPVGFLDTFTITEKGLEVSGYLTPGANGTAKDAAGTMLAGIPMQASINFADDTIGYEEIPAGVKATVNGREFEGELTVIRNWKLRGVALCRYGYDSRTKSELFSQGDREISAIRLNKQEELSMSAAPAPKTDPSTTPAAPAQPATTAAAKETAAPQAAQQLAASDPRAEFKAMVSEFGAEAGAKYFGEGLTVAQAKDRHYEAMKAELSAANAKVAELAKGQATPNQPAGPDVERNKGAAPDAAAQLAMKHGLSEDTAAWLSGTQIIGAPKV